MSEPSKQRKQNKPISFRLSDEDRELFDQYLERNDLTASGFLRDLILREITSKDSFSLRTAELKMLDNFAANHGNLSRREAIYKLLTEQGDNLTPMVEEMAALRGQFKAIREEMFNLTIAAMVGIPENIKREKNGEPSDTPDQISERLRRLIVQL